MDIVQKIADAVERALGDDGHAVVYRGEQVREAIRQALGDCEAVAWMTDDGRVCNAETKATAMHEGTAASYCIPLFLNSLPAAGGVATLRIDVELDDGTTCDITCHGSERDMRRLEARLKHLRALESATYPAPSHSSDAGGDDDEDDYQLGKRDGYEEAMQEIDVLTGGDGEYTYCMDGDPDHHCPDAESMKRRIVERFADAPARDVPEGMALVPVCPTTDMLMPLRDAAPKWNARSLYAAVLAAAPKGEK